MSNQTTPARGDTRRRRAGAAHPGPPLGVPAIAFAATFLVAILCGPVSGAGPQPSPFSGPAGPRSYALNHPTVLVTSGWLLLLSALALTVLAALTFSRLDYLAPNAPGPAIAGFAGILAASLLAVSAVLTWVLSRTPSSVGPGQAEMIQYLNFLTGGPAHTAALGIMVLGFAVTALFLGRTPRWLSLVGFVIAALGLLSTVVLLSQTAVLLVPVARFAAIIWLVAMALLLPRDRVGRATGTATATTPTGS